MASIGIDIDVEFIEIEGCGADETLSFQNHKYIANELSNRGYKPGIVSRGYGGRFKETLQVTDESSVKETGDEAQIFAASPKLLLKSYKN